MKTVTSLACTLLALAGAACTDTDSATNLNPEGPPMLRQVRMDENVVVSGSVRSQRVFAFGTHPLADMAEVHPVTSAAALVDGRSPNSMRLIIDELLVGNNLEEIACRGNVDDDAYSRVPLGATPDDVARCSTADDVLKETCPNDAHAICICQNDAGCTRGTDMVAKGEPVGILDINQDGGADDTRFIAGAVGIKCGDIDVPIDLDKSYWNPSGDQNKPAMGGFDALGPAVVLTPSGPLPTNITCGLTFADDVVDKSGNKVCAPADGDIKAGCTPGDMSAFTFTVEPMTVTPNSFNDNMPGVSRTDDAIYQVNTIFDDASLTKVTMTEGGAPFTGFTIKRFMPNQNIIQVTYTAQLKAMTVYTITFPTTFTDKFQRGLPAAKTITFTTGA